MDSLLTKLEKSGVGCYMGGVYAGAFAYADDLTLLSPSVHALRMMTDICNDYAAEYDVKFNAKKSQLIVFKCSTNNPPDPHIKVNGDVVKVVSSIVHLGHKLNDHIYDFDVSKCIGDFNRQCNMFFADFSRANSHIRNVLFRDTVLVFMGHRFSHCLMTV